MSRKNKYNEDVAASVVEGTASDSVTFTYVGAGEDPPRRINFMGKQEFVRGVPTQITDEEVYHKIVDHPCFREGEVSMEEIHAQDEAASANADRQRKADAKLNAKYLKKHGPGGSDVD